ncbi:uncharacterized protein LOC142767211 [Rhipicephalus microplus]|uniref:uncharacterized protein LOC142767211 n=1 Tax=Rhipicephalus microplus TaxID=6941 RepID=UPI003F6BF29A
MWCNALYASLESVGVTGSIYLGIVRFNNFKNDYHRDVYIVLVADTASELLRTAITFMFLGHLASAIGTDVRTLVGIESSLVAGIMPQALSAVPYQELWSQVHALWLLSTMLPKFFVVPDIVIEVLSQAQPYTMLNRTLIHFFVCVTVMMTSVAVCSPGGANMAAIIVHNHDQKLRFLLLFLESIVLLQFYGVRRLDIACRMMCGRDCSDFVKVCLASVIPLIVISLFFAKLVSKHSEDGTYPVWIYAVITWFSLVLVSFIPVFAIVLLTDVNLTLQNLLFPLPTWVPLKWEQAMFYRKTLVVEGFDSDAARNPNPRSRVQARGRQQSRRAGKHSRCGSSKSSTELLGSDFVMASDGVFALPGTNTPMKERQAKSGPPGSSGVASLSGTVHVSRNLSSIRRSAQRLELQAEDKVSQVAMALVSEAEVDENRGVCVVSVTQPISGTGPSFKEPSQKTAVVAAPAAELPDKIGPEASNITNEVFPAASAVRVNTLKGHSHATLQGDLTKLGVKGSASSATVPQKLTYKPSSVKSTKGDADKFNKSVPCSDLSGQQKLRSSLEKLQSGKSSTRGSDKPAGATVPQVADSEMKPSMSTLKQPRASIASNKSRMSVDQMLFLNKQLPSDSEQGVLQSDVNVVVAIEAQPVAAQQMAEGAFVKELSKGQQAQPEPEEQQPQVKQQPLRGETGAVGGPERSAEVGPGKNVKGGSSKRSKAERRRLKLLAKKCMATNQQAVTFP